MKSMKYIKLSISQFSSFESAFSLKDEQMNCVNLYETIIEEL